MGRLRSLCQAVSDRSAKQGQREFVRKNALAFANWRGGRFFFGMHRFGKDFIFGTATAACQIEGAWDQGGRGPSIWDAFSSIPGKIHDGDTPAVACDHFHRLEEDIALLEQLGVQAYRFSISWSRIMPLGYGEVSKEGLAFYDRLIDGLLAKGITPWVTLFHWDLPLGLQLEKDGLLNREIVGLFGDYAERCFEHFGDRVKNWITLNEPWCSAVLGHGIGYFAPGRVSTSEPYLAAHHLILAHGEIVDRYRKKFQDAQKGQIGITNNCDWREPRTDKAEDRKAAERGLEFFLSWFADPIYRGDYPESMRQYVGDRLPVFSEEERRKLVGSSDFFGLNHYTTMLASEFHEGDQFLDTPVGNGGMADDQKVVLTEDRSWEKTDMGWNVAPWGCRKLLQWVSERYDNPPIYITENGCALPGEDDVEVALADRKRIEFVGSYLEECLAAMESGVNLKGYFYWSFMDNFEWALGYSKRFGLHHVDYRTQARTPKSSARWYQELCDARQLPKYRFDASEGKVKVER